MKKILASGIVAIAAIAILATTFNVASAQSTGNPSLVQRIAERFNLQKSEVQSVFDEAREEKVGMMQERMGEKLNDLVEKGTITEEQKEEFLVKKEEMGESIQGIRDEFKNWVEDNGMELLMGKGPMGEGSRRGGGEHFGGGPPPTE